MEKPRLNLSSLSIKEKDFSTYFDTGEFLFKEGDLGDFAYIIESGEIEVFHRQGNRKLVLSNLVEGDMLGEMAIIDKRPRTASAQAKEPTRVLAIPLDYLEEKIADSDPTIRLLLRYVMSRYREVHTRFTQVFDDIEELNGIPPGTSDAESTAEYKNVISQYQQMQKRLHNAVNMPASPNDENLIGEQTLFNTKLQVTQDKSIKSALQDEEFLLHFQPIVNLKSNRIVGCEALVRWLDSSGKLIPPSEFIPRAEMTGLIIDLGYWIVRKACEFQHQLALQFNKPVFVSINLSGKQFDDPFLIDTLADIMNDTGATRELIKFEITESLLMENPEIAIDALHRLKKTGAKLAIDDFGTGYSSFSYLHQLPFDTLKIDRAFVSSMARNMKSNGIVKTLVHLSHDLGMDVVAEGIENKFEIDMLRNYGADFGQGFFYAKGMKAKRMIKLINKQVIKSSRQ